ncbi:MBL fold metallo-hydrolase [Sporolactobacillus vineae]|uniref:MBL fold metallo-hydrolase n=1 Tax=Sporolactobacillus vineae TaxID=444463 RepID=UPI000288D0F5|nr:MBL fold metallo-hydrolase [Sporolactobacillus vineae]
MKVTILGGGNEIGASCTYIQIGGTSLIVDAGMRVHGDDVMPATGMLDQLDKPAAILVTHAHADHIGALPVIHRIYPDVPIFATPPTADLMQIMMHDSFKIMKQRCQDTRTLIPYTKEQMEETLRAVRLFPASGSIRFGDLSVRLHRAGHILGAVMFVLEGGGEKLLVSGDLSFNAGRTIPGAEVPSGERPDAMLIESTYGNREHSDRNTEEKRLADNVAEVIAGGGFALIPAFALGRAQEVLLILQDYMDRGLIPEFPIYVDGLVTPICKIYRRYPQYLKGPVARRIRMHGDVFLTEGRCTAVEPKDRENVLRGKPACIVASSGMLIGGASVWYAERLVSGDKNAIFITGYQDEESPGRKLLSLAEGQSRELELNGTLHPVRCRVGKYGLSAHADAGELTRFVAMVRPSRTLIVHGDDDARVALQERIDRRNRPMLSENMETYTFEREPGRPAGVQMEQPHGADDRVGKVLLYREDVQDELKIALCVGLHRKTRSFVCRTPKGKMIRLVAEQVTETLGGWNRSFDELKESADKVLRFSRPFLEKIRWDDVAEGTYTFEKIAGLCLPEDDLKLRITLALALQSLSAASIERDGSCVRYRLNHENLTKLSQLALPIQGMKMNKALAMDQVRTLFAANRHFLRCGVDSSDGREQITLYFDFPAVIGSDERKRLRERILSETGWTAVISESVRIDLLQALINEQFGTSGSPSIYLESRTAGLPIARPEHAADKIERIRKETGFTVVFKSDSEAAAPSAGQDPFYQAKTPSPVMENNEAIRETGRWAKDRGITLYKASLKQTGGKTYMEVHFITPEVARRHESDLEELSYRIGRPVTYARNPKQNEIIRIASEKIPASWGMTKNPSLHTAQAELSVRLPEQPPAAELQQICDTIEQLTGYRLIIDMR